MDGINEKLNEYKTKYENSFLLHLEHKNRQWDGFPDFRERRSDFSLDFPVFGPSVCFRTRSKVVLRGKGYAWTPIWWSSTTPRGRDLFLLMLFFG